MKTAVDKIVLDLTDRRGLKQEWYQIDTKTQEEIKQEWSDIIDSEIKSLIGEIDVKKAVKDYLVRVGSVDRKDIIAYDYVAGITFAKTELRRML